MVADQLTFIAYEDYWRAKPQIREMHWIQYADATTMAQALLAGDLHLCSGAPSTFIAQFEADEDLIVHPKKQTAVIQYLGFNCGAYNKTMRQAMSYALDYDYYIDEILQGNGVRMTSIVPTGMKFHVDCNVATYNVTHARKILCDAGIAPDELTPTSDDAYWIGLAAATPILTVNYTYNIGNEQRADMATATRLMLRKIGVKCSTGGLTWSEYLDVLYTHTERMGIFALGWAPDYNDPSNYINPLLMSTSAANHFSYADDDMDQMMADALEITDEAEKADAYEEIQRVIAEDEMPLAFLMYGVSRTVHSKKVCDIPRNVMSKIEFYEYSYKDVDFCTATVETTTTADTDTVPPIAGYGFFALLGACALSIAAIVMKKRH
jgi:ABC-type transport system substrate-binding protein